MIRLENHPLTDNKNQFIVKIQPLVKIDLQIEITSPIPHFLILFTLKWFCVTSTKPSMLYNKIIAYHNQWDHFHIQRKKKQPID